MGAAPYVVGQWVRGEKFYGRSTLIEEILSGPRNWLWLLGTRRIGKTSLLKQIELITDSAPEPEYLPVFWDFQGAATIEELHNSFADALLDTDERLARVGIDVAEVEHENLFQSIKLLRRKLRGTGLRLLLLCDEVEELITLNKEAPSLLSKLRRLMQSQDDVRSVLASTIKLWELAGEHEDTSPFLHGFLPPLYIHNLSEDESRSLIRQVHTGSQSRPPFDDATVEAIRNHCDDHPYLIQLVCRRLLVTGKVDNAIEQVASDPMVSHFFAVDFDMLTQTERSIVRLIAQRTKSTSQTIQARFPVETDRLRGLMHRLEHLGYIRRNRERRYELINYFFRRWFADRPISGSPSGDRSQPQPTPPHDVERGAAVIASRPGSLPPLPAGTRRLAQDVRELLEGPDTVADGPELLDDRYELLERVGEGAAGVVYRAHDNLLRVDVAIKILKPHVSADPASYERFRQEIVLSREISHPNVLRLYHLGQHEDRAYVTMKWVDGPTLAQVLQTQAPLAIERTLAMAVKLTGALAALHAHGVLHRDVKPGNILIDTATGEPHLSDFGLARLMGQPGMTSVGVFLGTPEYSSPEQVCRLPVDERSDLYSFGVVLFEMCTGRRPFQAESRKSIMTMHRDTPAPPPRDFNPTVPPALERLILATLEKEPSRRPASAKKMRAELQRLLDDAPR